MRLTIIGLVLIGFGVLYLRKPTVYRRGIWMKTSVAIRTLSEENGSRPRTRPVCGACSAFAALQTGHFGPRP